MASFNAMVFISVLSGLHQASCNEASSITTQGVYQAVRYRVRDIVGMLHDMQTKVAKDGEDDTELFSKYMFYCKKGRKSMEASIEEAQDTDLESLKVSIADEEDAREEILGYVAEDAAKKQDATAAIVKAKALRDYESVVFQEESGKLHNDIASLKQAVGALDKGDGLQDSTAHLLKQLSGSMDIKKHDRGLLTSLLEQVNSDSEDSVPNSKEIRTILTHMTEIMEEKLAVIVDEEKNEKEAFQSYKEMIRDKEQVLKSDMQDKRDDVDNLDEEIDAQKADLEDSARYLMEGPAFLPFLSDSENCTKHEDEWGERCQMRTQELSAIAEAVTILTDETLLDELLQKSLPDPWQEGSFHARVASKRANRTQIADGKFNLVSFAMKGKNATFDKIHNVIDGMVIAMLGKEKSSTDHGKYCGQSIDQAQDNLKKLTVTVSELGMIIGQHEKTIATLTGDINNARADIEKLDEHVVTTGKVRKQEFSENAEILTSNSVALHLFRDAADRLRTFYSEGDPITFEEDGVTLAEVIGPYMKQREGSNTTISLLDATIDELSSEVANLEAKEHSDQDKWEKAIKESLAKHTNDMKSISDKQDVKAELEASLISVGERKTEVMNDVKSSNTYISELQGNHTGFGFLQASVCTRKPAMPKNMDAAVPRSVKFW